MADITIPVVEIDSEEGKKVLASIDSDRDSRNDEVEAIVKDIFDNIATSGDTALFDYCEKLDKRTLTADTIGLSKEYIKAQAAKVSPELATSIKEAAKRIETYHAAQKIDRSFSIDTEEGTLSQHLLPLERVALYIPGGYTVYPSTVLMTGIPAKLAGVDEIVAVTPCRDGEIAPEIAFVLDLLEIYEVYQMGGAHAVAALAYGTDTIKKVDKVVGPGNSFVATAKKLAYGMIDIDSIAGPSDICILADDSANAEWVALDILSQAEHGSGDEAAILVTESLEFAKAVHTKLFEEIEKSPVQEIFSNLSENAIALVVTPTRKEAIDFVNKIGPEHLEIITENPREDLKSIRNAAAIFLGQYSPVPLGDYVIGTNHVLPTGGASRYASPLGVDDFVKRVSVCEVTEAGIKNVSEHLSRFARSEKFVHHAMCVERRTGIEVS